MSEFSDCEGLLTIVVVIAAVIVKFPPGAHQVVTDNPVIQQQLSDIAKQFIAKKFEDIENKIEVLESKVNTNSKTNCEQPSKLDELENNIIKINNILSPSDPDDILHPVMKTKVRENIQDITKIKTDIADVKNNHNALNRKVDRIQNALTAAILILFFLIIGLMLYVLKLKSSLEPSLAGGSTSRPLKGSREMKVILQKMPSNPTLDNAVCIVSFDASHSDEYKRMIKETVGQLGRVSFRTHVIRKHADIAELPHCRLYIMCVEFTRRHVIIEEQGLGLGDLKLTSYRGALVILYIHDPGSRNLTDDQLYSDGVYCVKKQQELKELCEIDRFISAHKNLNTAQKKALETAITDELKIQAAR
ncbi:hypothetical protein MAR_020058 [Mya arenaria]|uniref:Uncharacterized protein n=1 Tax=Mya arenaria TaxID=6604 RepID=A0ABY7E6B2_MYAAR|nr:hypothetical protein MAR_020058 [Mya arenaria]